jgi:phosphoesterase RecJ-like protein
MDASLQNPPAPPADVSLTAPSPESSAEHIQAILDVLRRGQRFLVCSHAQPDGDAVGSMLALGMVLSQMGKHADLYTADRIPAVYQALPGAAEIHIAATVQGSYDAAILLECDGLPRTKLHGLDKFFLINIDHHISGQQFGHLNWIDRHAASVGELVYRLAQAAGATVTPAMATCLYTSVLTDTGSFCYGSTRASTFGLARDLVLAGADPIRIARDLYFSTTASRLLLLGAALSNLKREGRLAWLWVTHQDVVRTCAAEEDCEGIVNFAISVTGVEAAVFLREMPDHSVRLSMRSKGQINVAALAERLGGGGHETASGCSLPGPLFSALDRILAELRPAVAHLAETTGPEPH